MYRGLTYIFTTDRPAHALGLYSDLHTLRGDKGNKVGFSHEEITSYRIVFFC